MLNKLFDIEYNCILSFPIFVLIIAVYYALCENKGIVIWILFEWSLINAEFSDMHTH